MRTARVLLCLFLIPQLLFAPYLQGQELPYRLVDTDQYDIFEEEHRAKAEQELQIEDAPDDAQLLKYTNEFWRQAVTAVEGDYILDKEPEPIPDLTLLNPTLALPLYGTNVALTGRYLVGFKLNAKRFTQDANNDIEERNIRTMEMQQELQLKMQGKILDRIFVDIDYDDKREEEKTISVAYRGKPGELVQLAEFGDINLSLPQTEFISYEKKLFGAKMHLQHKDLNLYVIGSQTKGSNKQKQFVGSSVFEITSIKDTDYIRRTYYDLTFGSNTPPGPNTKWISTIGNIAPGTEEIYVATNTTSMDNRSWGSQLKTNFDMGVGATVSIPLFDNRQAKTALNKARLQREKSLLDLREQEKNLYNTIEGYWIEGMTNQSNFKAAREATKSQEASYELLSEQFRLGLKNIVELMTGKTNLVNAQQNELQSKYLTILDIYLLKLYQR